MGSALASAGSVVVAVGAALAALAAVIGIAVIAFNVLSSAAKATAERIAAVGKYSGAVTVATASERVSALMRDISEAQINGRAYSEAQRAATRSADAWTPILIALRNATAKLATVFFRLSEGVANFLTNFASVIATIARMASISFRNMAFTTLGTSLIGMKVFDIIASIADDVAAVKDNTKPRLGTQANQWFLDDIRAMTGRAY